MAKVLFITDIQKDGTITKASLEALTAAMELSEALSAELNIGLFGEKVQEAAKNFSQKVYGVEGEAFADSRYGTDAAAIEALSRTTQAEVVMVSHTTRLSRVLSGVAFRLNGRVDTHVAGFSAEGGELKIQRWYYKQRMEGELKRKVCPWFLSMDPGNFTPFQLQQGSGEIEILKADIGQVRTTVEGIKEPAADEQTIKPDADILFVAGAGWTKKQSDGNVHAGEASNLILDFLKKAKASLGGSKSVVDLSGEGQAVLPFMTHLNQVGQTGSSPRHPKGLAACCHGEEPHVIGWRFIKERRAVNKDASCGWAQGKADVLYVADAFEVMAKVNELL